MPINITQGNTAQFTVEFLDSTGKITVPAAGSIVITYTSATTGVQTTQTINLSAVGSLFTGTWQSSVAALGLAPWQAFATGSSNVPMASDTIRVIDP